MICPPCKAGVHRGDPERVHLSTPLCPGNEQCPCQHRVKRTNQEEPK